jgi:cell division septation protein DedD
MMGHMLPAAPETTQRKAETDVDNVVDPQAEAGPASSSDGARYHANGPKPPPMTGFNDAVAQSPSEMAYEAAHPALHDEAVAARRYNDAHPDFVARFNAATNHVCMIDGDVDIAAVKSHQTNWGVAADGKVGPKTVDAAERLGKTIGVASADGIAMTNEMLRDEDQPVAAAQPHRHHHHHHAATSGEPAVASTEAAPAPAAAPNNVGTVSDEDRKWALSQLE